MFPRWGDWVQSGVPDLPQRHLSYNGLMRLGKKRIYPWGIQGALIPEHLEGLEGPPSALEAEAWPKPILPFGLGRSYGDSCLSRGTMLSTALLDHFVAFDPQTGIFTCEAGTSFREILAFAIPKGWFLPVTPGTQFVTVGGAIANDVHGKNHHKRGTFGCHLREIELWRSDGKVQRCSQDENNDLFCATVGGLGLTGLVLRAKIQLIPIESAYIDVQVGKFKNLDEYFSLASQLDARFEYTVSWIDCLSRGAQLGRGVYLGGNHATTSGDGSLSLDHSNKLAPKISVPLFAPAFALNPLSVKAFNELYYWQQKEGERREYFGSFFYPLDSVNHWNRIYGKRGFLQYQLLLPFGVGKEVLKEVLDRISFAKLGSFLVVLKNFGDMPSPGLLSFPAPGYTLALDFPYTSAVLKLLSELDELVSGAGGRLYPAKDARMGPEHFRQFFPKWQDFRKYIDPAFSSCFWERMNHEP